MKKFLLSLLVGALTISAAGSAAAYGYYGHGPRVGVGIVIGGPAYYPGYYPGYPSYYTPYAPPIYVTPAPLYQSPPVYVEKSDDYWYYCVQSATYYPYVKDCPQGWLKVVPHSPR